MEPDHARLENEVRFGEFYYSGEPETTPYYPLKPYFHPAVKRAEDDTGESAMVLSSIAAPGDMLIVENTFVSCACTRDCSPQTGKPSTSTATTVPSDRIPPEVHKHLAVTFARLIAGLEAIDDPDEKLLEYILLLDARPVNAQVGVNRGSRKDNRGPWNEVETAGGLKQRSRDADRVWNIIANHAICFEVRSQAREQPSQVETCEFWGMWTVATFVIHSCVPNCHAMRVGNAIIIRAARAIETGEPLTVPYFDIFQPLCKRELAAQKWGFRCPCNRCVMERALGKRYDDVQKQVVGLEQQIQKSWALENMETRRKVADRLLEKLLNLYRTHVKQIVTGVEQNIKLKMRTQDWKNFSRVDQEVMRLSADWIIASFSEPLIAWYAFALRNAYECPIRPDFPSRAKRAERFRDLITCVKKIIEVLSSTHRGNLLCEEFCSILLKARNDLIDDDLDEKFTAEIDSEEWYVTMANDLSRSYYGPNVKVF